jgi:hypothetical protein
VAFGGKGERGRSVLGWRTVGVGVAALALIVGGVVWFRSNTAEAAVGGFLAALARGDATAALSYAANTPDDTSLLTDAVLAESIKMAPITDIDVAENADHSVVAKYHLGGAPVTATYYTVKIGAVWKLGSVTASLQSWPGKYSADALPVQVNGVAVTDGEALTLFPGAYAATSPDDRFEVIDGGFTVTDPEDRVVSASDLSLTDKGVADFVAAAKAKLSGCLEQKSATPAGCNLTAAVRESGVVDDSSIEWAKLGGDAIPEQYVLRELSGSQGWIDYPADHYLELPFSYLSKDGSRKTSVTSVLRITGAFTSAGVAIYINR